MEDFQKKFVQALLAYCVKRDVDIKALCLAAGIDLKKLSGKTDYPVTPMQMNELWKNAAHLSHDPLFGLHFGESMQLAALGVIGQIVQTSATVGQAVANAGALTHLITDMFQMRLEHHKKTFSVHLIVNQKKAGQWPYTYRHMADYLMVFMIHEMDGLLLEKINPLSVQLPYHTAEPYEYTRVFRCPKIGRAEQLSLEFPLSYLDLPVLSANYELQDLLLQKMRHLLAGTEEPGAWQHKVYNYLLTNSYLNSFSQQAVAANFNISLRNLQRRLKEEGTSYQQISEKAKKTLAVNYLSNGNYPVKDIANILGYNEQSAFLRAFKRWTGKTPQVFRTETKL